MRISIAALGPANDCCTPRDCMRTRPTRVTPLTRIAWLVRARLQVADGTRGHVGGVGAAQRCPVPARAQLARSDCHGKCRAPARVQLDSKLVLAHPMHVSLRRRRLAKEIPPPPSPAASATPRRLARMSASGGGPLRSSVAGTQGWMDHAHARAHARLLYVLASPLCKINFTCGHGLRPKIVPRYSRLH